MATTTITITSFQNALAECADAIASEDWATARKWYARAETICAGLDVEAAHESSRARRRESLAAVDAAITAAKTETAAANDSQRRLIKTRTSWGR